MPFLSGFGKRKEIRYGTSFPGANLDDFPKLLKIAADSDIAAELASGGGIALTGDDGTTAVPFGLYPSSDPTSGDLILRAKFPTLLTAASTGDVLGYIYYDSAQTTSEDKAGVVANGYVLFMPLEEDPSGSSPQMYDWVSESNVGTSNGSMTSGDLVTGQVGSGLDLDGSDDHIGCGAVANLSSTPFTVECDFCPRTIDGGWKSLVGKNDSGNFNRQFWLAISGGYNSTSNSLVFFTGYDGDGSAYSLSTLSADNWYHGAGVWSGSAASLYLDGVLGTNGFGTSSPDSDASNAVEIGRFTPGSPLGLHGIIDEIRISSVARSADWLAYAYADDFANGGTFTLGAEEAAGGGGAVTADLSVTLAGLTLSASAAVAVAASATPTLAAPAISSAGTVSVVAGVSQTLAGPTPSSAASVAVVASLASTLAGVTLSSACTAAVAASATPTLAGPSLSSSCAVTVTASLSATFAGPTLDSNIPAPGGVVATADVTLAGPTLSAACTVTVTASATTTLPAPSLASACTVSVVASLSATLAGPTLYARIGEAAASPVIIRIPISSSRVVRMAISSSRTVRIPISL